MMAQILPFARPSAPRPRPLTPAGRAVRCQADLKNITLQFVEEVMVLASMCATGLISRSDADEDERDLVDGFVDAVDRLFTQTPDGGTAA